MRARALDGKPLLRIGRLEAKTGNLWAMLGLALLCAALAAWSVSLGAIDLSFADVLRVIFTGQGSEDEIFAVWHVRMPRILMGLMAGASVALAGAMLQSLAQNPLADPGLLGLSQGSLVVIMIFIVFFPGLPRDFYPLGALGGGLAVGLLLLLLTGRGAAGGVAILLAGIAVESVLSAISAMLLIHTPVEISFELGIWLNGSLYFSDWSGVARYGIWAAMGLPILILAGQSLRALELGEDMARALGEPTLLSRPLILIAAVFITAASVTEVGPLSFLGILAPHLAGFLSPATGKARLALAALMGAALVISADTVTRALTTTLYVPIGLTIVAIGAPLFITTLRLRSLRQNS